jgi:hypothetical protein
MLRGTELIRENVWGREDVGCDEGPRDLVPDPRRRRLYAMLGQISLELCKASVFMKETREIWDGGPSELGVQ